MKFNKISALILSLFLVFVACETEESIDITTPEASFTLLEPAISNINLNYNLPNNEAFTIVWNDQLDSGDSYIVELSPDALFENPTVIGSSSTDRFTMTVAEFNNTLLGAGADAFEPFTVFMRVTAGSITTNSVSFSVSSYSEAIPVITSPDNTFEIVLLETTLNDEAIAVSWEDPDFGENTTVTVNYEIQFAQAGTDFASAVSEIAEGMTYTSTHEAFNEIVLNAGLTAEEAASLDVRIKATIEMDGGNMERYSDPITITVTPFNIELAPVLYIVGAGAVDAGWDWATPVELPLQGTKYSGNINLINDAFRFFTVAEDWGSGLNYPYYEAVGYTIDSNLVNALDGDSNFQFTGTPGEYFIEIDTEAKTITLGPPVVGPNCNFDQLWLVGAGIADAGWAWDTPVALPCTGNGTYSGNVALINDAFRFFNVNGDWGTGTNYPTYEGMGYTIDSNFSNAMDGDSNFSFNGTPGTYFLTVDDINKTITLGPEQLQCEYEQLYLVGAGVVGTGWDWANPAILSCTGAGIYSGEVEFTNDAFRFFTVNGDWGTGTNYPTYENEGYIIDANFSNAMDGDSNFSFDGTPGTYTLTVDTLNLTITLD
ncbi:SusE domain-containing protein [Winogradskyella sediminis]|uniref:SusE outer membrane protein n=1 Tax=Winogradskyella sediminis TaxID=1382466 RepID=A0A1H1QIY1_9FLAO|nr:SusE domain-containing protein [Winogradskyella sediminis]REG89776.1 SusE-like outer membrane protein [Winogradskyella sediminis]SDS23336.1 SusE outer membrane protein [Winogradskyella sediminis]